MRCWQPFGLPVVPLVYMRKSGASAVLGDRLDDLVAVILENVIDEEVAVDDHRGFGTVVTVVAPPEKNLVDVLAFFFCRFDGDVGARLVIDPLAVAMIAVSVDEHAAAGIGGAQAARFSAESAEDHGMNHAEARAGQHGDGQLGNHRHVNGDAVAGI